MERDTGEICASEAEATGATNWDKILNGNFVSCWRLTECGLVLEVKKKKVLGNSVSHTGSLFFI